MNKALPWNVNGVGFDAREAAREAARRQGKSLGEWLHGVIADHAADLGVEAHEIAGQQRVEAVTSKLERLSARSAAHDRRMKAGRGNEMARRRSGRDLDEDLDDREEPSRLERSSTVTEFRRRRERPSPESTDLLLEEAIEAMERRALRAERHTDKALQSLTTLLERNEAHRERERDSVTDLAKKLSDIETRLTDRFGQTVDSNPINGALARLEARLDMIGRRGAAETAARQKAEANPSLPVPPEPFQRLEEKLNSIFAAVQARPPQPAAEASPIAITAAQSERGYVPAKDRRLGEAIAEIAKRQRSLQEGDAEPLSPPSLRRQGDAMAPRPEARSSESVPFVTMQNEIAALATKIEDLRRDLVPQRRDRVQPDLDLDGLRTEIASMSKTLREFVPRSGLSDIETSIRALTERIENRRENGAADTAHDHVHRMRFDLEPRDRVHGPDEHLAPTSEAINASLSAIAGLNDQMREIRDLIAANAAKIDRAVETTQRQDTSSDLAPSAPGGGLGGLEMLVRDLGQKIEAVQAPGAGHQALDALQQQVALLSARFERSDDGLSKLTALERSMRGLFAHLDETRATVETTAARAAREALLIAMEEGRVQSDQGRVTSLATLQALQDEAEARTSSTLNAVHVTLEKVVDRLSVMETEIAGSRQRPNGRSVEARTPEIRTPEARVPDMRPPEGRPQEFQPAPSSLTLGAPDPLLHQPLGHKPADKAAKTPSAAGRALDIDDESGRADFIAAARRAAKVAQTDPAFTALKRPGAPKGSSPVRAGLIEQTRDYVTRHKRPVLLSIAALFVIIGTMAIIQRIGVDDGDSQNADLAAPARVVSAAPPTPKTRQVRSTDELSPSALPVGAPSLANPIPGSDPIQTGSIPSLPAFAAAGGPGPVARPAATLSANLKAKAEAGDGPAEYVLGTQYAEGSAVPRDFSLAAKWYAKAAAQNLAPAQYRLASLYEKGLGVTQDKAKAEALYLQAAEAGNPRAMHNLAVLLADGDGHPDYDGAATWFRKAAQYGIHDSQYNLAILLARGIGVPQSLVQSYQWFAIAAAQGDADAAKKRDEVGTKLGANDLAVAKALASSFHPRIADLAATEVQPPPGGWDGAPAPSPLNSARPKISSL